MSSDLYCMDRRYEQRIDTPGYLKVNDWNLLPTSRKSYNREQPRSVILFAHETVTGRNGTVMGIGDSVGVGYCRIDLDPSSGETITWTFRIDPFLDPARSADSATRREPSGGVCTRTNGTSAKA